MLHEKRTPPRTPTRRFTANLALQLDRGGLRKFFRQKVSEILALGVTTPPKTLILFTYRYRTVGLKRLCTIPPHTPLSRLRVRVDARLPLTWPLLPTNLPQYTLVLLVPPSRKPLQFRPLQTPWHTWAPHKRRVWHSILLLPSPALAQQPGSQRFRQSFLLIALRTRPRRSSRPLSSQVGYYFRGPLVAGLAPTTNLVKLVPLTLTLKNLSLPEQPAIRTVTPVNLGTVTTSNFPLRPRQFSLLKMTRV